MGSRFSVVVMLKGLSLSWGWEKVGLGAWLGELGAIAKSQKRKRKRKCSMGFAGYLLNRSHSIRVQNTLLIR